MFAEKSLKEILPFCVVWSLAKQTCVGLFLWDSATFCRALVINWTGIVVLDRGSGIFPHLMQEAPRVSRFSASENSLTRINRRPGIAAER